MKEMVEKVNVAIFGSDLQVAPIKSYEVDDTGSKIRINPKGGKGHFMPSFTTSSYLDFPTTKRFLFFGKQNYKRVYIVRKLASECVDFHTPHVPVADPKQVMDAANSELIRNFGREEKDTPWQLWGAFFFAMITFLLVLVTSGAVS